MSKRNKLTSLPLLEYLDKFLASRDVGPQYAASLRARLEKFRAWFVVRFGHEPTIGEIDCDVANEWLAAITPKIKSPRTVDGYRRNLLVVWNDALVAGANDNAPNRLRKIRKPHIIIEAYSHDEIKRLLQACRKMRGTYPHKISKEFFWRAAIHAGYSTGLRLGDLLAVKRTQIGEDGSAIVVQKKTQYPVRVHFSAPAMNAIAKVRNIDGRALPFTMTRNWMYVEFRKLRTIAGITRGSFKWLRRSAGSYAERAQYGQGSQLLGHRDPKVFRNHYEDWSVSVQKAVAPPAVQG